MNEKGIIGEIFVILLLLMFAGMTFIAGYTLGHSDAYTTVENKIVNKGYGSYTTKFMKEDFSKEVKPYVSFEWKTKEEVCK